MNDSLTFIFVFTIMLLFGLVSYVILNWFHSQIKIKNRTLSFISSAIGSVILIFLMIFCSFWLVFRLNTFFIPKDFDKERWEQYPEQRYLMENDLIKSKLLIGKSKSEVAELLGEQDFSRDYWTYRLGEPQGLFLPTWEIHYLQIYFTDNKVQEVTFYTSD